MSGDNIVDIFKNQKPEIETKEAINLLDFRPYLFQARYQWIEDNNLTAHIVVKTLHGGVTIPPEVAEIYVKNHIIILNISSGAITDLEILNAGRFMRFKAYFEKIQHSLSVSIDAVQEIYIKENGQRWKF